MSQVYTDFGVLYYIYAGTKKNFTSIPIDENTGQSIDMTDQTIFTSGYIDITQADGTIIQGNIPIFFNDRNPGTSNVSWTAGPFTNNQAGNWMAFLKFVNINGDIIDQDKYNFNILEAF